MLGLRLSYHRAVRFCLPGRQFQTDSVFVTTYVAKHLELEEFTLTNFAATEWGVIVVAAGINGVRMMAVYEDESSYIADVASFAAVFAAASAAALAGGLALLFVGLWRYLKTLESESMTNRPTNGLDIDEEAVDFNSFKDPSTFVPFLRLSHTITLIRCAYALHFFYFAVFTVDFAFNITWRDTVLCLLNVIIAVFVFLPPAAIGAAVMMSSGLQLSHVTAAEAVFHDVIASEQETGDEKLKDSHWDYASVFRASKLLDVFRPLMKIRQGKEKIEHNDGSFAQDLLADSGSERGSEGEELREVDLSPLRGDGPRVDLFHLLVAFERSRGKTQNEATEVEDLRARFEKEKLAVQEDNQRLRILKDLMSDKVDIADVNCDSIIDALVLAHHRATSATADIKKTTSVPIDDSL